MSQGTIIVIVCVCLFPVFLLGGISLAYFLKRNYLGIRNVKWMKLSAYIAAPAPEMVTWLLNRFSFYQSLDRTYQYRLANRMKIFLLDLNFEEEGVKATEELKWILAATCAQITIGLERPWLKKNKRFIFTDQTSEYKKGLVRINAQELREGFYNGQDGVNDGIKLVFFALEYENRFREEEDFAELWSDTWYRVWLRATKDELQRLSALGFSSNRTGVSIDLNEFQHITIVYFFEMPEKLKQRHPNLYQATRKLMNWDPINKRKLEVRKLDDH